MPNYCDNKQDASIPSENLQSHKVLRSDSSRIGNVPSQQNEAKKVKMTILINNWLLYLEMQLFIHFNNQYTIRLATSPEFFVFSHTFLCVFSDFLHIFHYSPILSNVLWLRHKKCYTCSLIWCRNPCLDKTFFFFLNRQRS